MYVFIMKGRRESHGCKIYMRLKAERNVKCTKNEETISFDFLWQGETSAI